MIRFEWGQQTATQFVLREDINVDVQFRKYDGVGHEISEEALSDLLDWTVSLVDDWQRRSVKTGIEAFTSGNVFVCL